MTRSEKQSWEQIMNKYEYIVEPKSKAEEWCLRMGKQSCKRTNSIAAFAITFAIASSVLAGSLYFKYNADSQGMLLLVGLGFAWVWVFFWIETALLFHERRTFYRIVERLAERPRNEDS